MTGHNIKTHRLHFSSPTLTAASRVLIVAGLGLVFSMTRASASLPIGDDVNLTSIAAAPNGGFWVQVDGGRTNKDNGGSRTITLGAPQFANVAERGTIVSIPGQEGYWVVTPKGKIYARGSAPELCGGELNNCSGFDPSGKGTIVAAAATPDGLGLWAVGRFGAVWTAGSAHPYGDVTKDSKTPTGIVATPSGKGYYIVLDDGGVYSFGDAVFHGSTGGKKPGGKSVTGLAASFDASGKINGYWMVGKDGGVFTYGDAHFLGSSGGDDGGSPVTGIAALPDGHAYVWVHEMGFVDRSQTFPEVVITSANWGTVWSVPGDSKQPSTSLQLMNADGATSQLWHIWPTTSDGKVVQLVNVNSGLCADVTALNKYPTTPFLIQYSCKGKNENWDNQRFTLTSDGAGHVTFVPLNNPGYFVGAQAATSGLTLMTKGTNGNIPVDWTLKPAK